eukprot:1159831-Pelagomonas_calceolata.AAC.14
MRRQLGWWAGTQAWRAQGSCSGSADLWRHSSRGGTVWSRAARSIQIQSKTIFQGLQASGVTLFGVELLAGLPQV